MPQQKHYDIVVWMNLKKIQNGCQMVQMNWLLWLTNYSLEAKNSFYPWQNFTEGEQVMKKIVALFTQLGSPRG
jgi:hypothetical protein